MTQSDLADTVGVDKRQIRRYEAGETQPTLPVAAAIARAFGITIDELAGEDTHRIDLTGEWWAVWQTFKDGEEVIAPQRVEMTQSGNTIQISSTTRGVAPEGGGYLWRGELKLWDNEILLGWYVASEAAVRAKGTMYFLVHRHGINLTGRWVGLSYDGPITTGWAVMAKDEQEAIALLTTIKQEGSDSND